MLQHRDKGLAYLGLTAATVVAIVALIVVAGWQVGLLDSVFDDGEVAPYEFVSGQYPLGEMGPDFTLTSHDGESFKLSDLRGDVVALYFGYTHCPDVCPLTLSKFARAKELLPENLRDDLKVVMVTVDPKRDTIGVLSQYVPIFDPAFIGVRGSEEESAAVYKDWRIYVEHGEPDENGAYLVGHPAFTILLDRNGEKSLKISHMLAVEDIAADLEAVLNGDCH